MILAYALVMTDDAIFAVPFLVGDIHELSAYAVAMCHDAITIKQIALG